MTGQNELEALIQRVQQTQHGFTDILRASNELMAAKSPDECLHLAHALFASPAHQARMLATYLFGRLAATHEACLQFMKTDISQDPNWRVQEILAQAFDQYCQDIGYERAIPTIEDWLSNPHPNVRRAVTEGLRIWTSRPYFREHPDRAIAFLSPLRGDESEYVRKSVGNALRDISKQHPERIRAELQQWDLTQKRITQTYKLASRFLLEKEIP